MDRKKIKEVIQIKYEGQPANMPAIYADMIMDVIELIENERGCEQFQSCPKCKQDIK